MRNITARGLQLIKQFEGFSSKIYQDSAGLKTIGYGHLILPCETSSFQNGINEAGAVTLLKKDVAIAEQAVSRLITPPINQNQFDALVSFCYNVGQGNLKSSTLLKKVNKNPDDSTIDDEFMKWTKAGGKTLPGLVRRRVAEAELYFKK